MRHLSVRQIAGRAGVSSTTVFHLLHRSRYTCPETIAKIVNAIIELGGDPGALGMDKNAMPARDRESFGLLVPDLTNPFFCELTVGFEESAAHLGYEPILGHSGQSLDRLRGTALRMMDEEVAGIAVMTSQASHELVQQLRAQRFPAVYLDMEMNGECVATVNLDYEAGMAKAIRHLAQLGHHRIAFIGGPDLILSVARRRSAYQSHMSALDFAPTVTDSDLTLDGGEQAARSLLTAPLPPTAIIAVNDLTALGALKAARALGIDVPRQLSVVGFDDIHWSQFNSPGLTTLSASPRQLGALAAIALDRILREPSHTGMQYRRCPQLIIRETTAPPCPRVATGSRSAMEPHASQLSIR